MFKSKASFYKRGPRINQQIRADEIQLIDEEGKHHNTYDITAALQRAVDLGLSLVEIRFDKKKPLCKIMDYGKYQYDKSKQESLNRKKQKTDKEKELQMTATTGKNDLLRIVSKAREMLAAGNKIKVVLMFRGRTIHHKDKGMENMKFFIDELADIGKVFSAPTMEGRKSICRIVPIEVKKNDSDDQKA